MEKFDQIFITAKNTEGRRKKTCCIFIQRFFQFEEYD